MKLNGISQETRAARMKADYSDAVFLSDRAYNLLMGGVVAYGLVLNYVMCLNMSDFAMRINPLLLLIGYVVCCFAGVIIAMKSDNPVISFIGYNLVCVPIGLVLSIVLQAYGGVNSEVVQQAFLYTLLITGVMVLVSILFPNVFSRLGGFLFAALGGLIIAQFVMMILGVSSIATAWIGAVIFSLYIGYDIYRSQQFPKTADNAVDCALDIYLDIINLFLDILRILGNSRD